MTCPGHPDGMLVRKVLLLLGDIGLAGHVQGAGWEGDFRAVPVDDVRNLEQYILLDLMIAYPLLGLGEGIDEDVQ